VQYGLAFDEHDDRYGRTREWLQVVDGLWSQPVFNHKGARYSLTDAICSPKPFAKPRPTVYAGGESEAAKTMIAECCDAYVMHGDEPEVIADKIADMRRRREAAGRPPMIYGMAAYAIVRDTEAEAKREIDRITTSRSECAGLRQFRPVALGHAIGAGTEAAGIFGLEQGPAPAPGGRAGTDRRTGRSVRGGWAQSPLAANEPAGRGDGAVFRAR